MKGKHDKFNFKHSHTHRFLWSNKIKISWACIPLKHQLWNNVWSKTAFLCGVICEQNFYQHSESQAGGWPPSKGKFKHKIENHIIFHYVNDIFKT